MPPPDVALSVRKVHAQFPDVKLDDVIINAMAAHLVRDPGRIDITAESQEPKMPNPPPGTIAHAPIDVQWAGALAFETGRPGGPTVRIDGDAQTAPSPFDLLLSAIATCSAVDVVTILKKQRSPVQALRIRVEAHRVESIPRRLASVILHFAITAPGTTIEKATRAVELSVTKYCSVRSSLIADASVSWTVRLEA